MKNKIFLIAMFLIASMYFIQLYAQLEVNTSGSVKVSRTLSIGTNPDDYIFLNINKMGPVNETTTYGIKSLVRMPACPIYTMYGIYGFANASNASAVHYPFPVIGVYGGASKKSTHTTLVAGVLGEVGTSGGVGVFGCVGGIPTAPIPANAKYAGYFNGATKVNGTLLANTILINGDTIHLANIRTLSNESGHTINLLRPISYSFKSDTTLQDDETTQREMESVHYGLIAQDVQKVFPELVYERDGSLYVNYIEMIPILLQEIQKLSAEVAELKKQNN